MAEIISRNGNKVVDPTASKVTQLGQKKNHFTKRIDGGVIKKFSALVN